MVWSDFPFFRSHIYTWKTTFFFVNALLREKRVCSEPSLFEGAFASTVPDFYSSILACENLSAAYSDTGRKAIAV